MRHDIPGHPEWHLITLLSSPTPGLFACVERRSPDPDGIVRRAGAVWRPSRDWIRADIVGEGGAERSLPLRIGSLEDCLAFGLPLTGVPLDPGLARAASSLLPSTDDGIRALILAMEVMGS